MKLRRIVTVAVPLVCFANIAMAFTPGVPPLSGPGSVFYGTDRDVAPRAQVQKSNPKQKLQKSQQPRSHVRQARPKQSQ
jgi:hypothetical protein